MATISERPATRQVLAESSRRVQDPLLRLRRYIRRYVFAESLLVVLSCLAACFWLGTLVDYGLFRLFGIDFVKDLPRWFRALGLGTALLCVFFFAEGIKALRTPARPEQVGDQGRAGLLVLLFSNPWLLAAVVAPILIVYLIGWVCLAALVESKTVGMAGVGVLIFGMVLALVAFVVLKRLVYEFRPAALALVLERRYPELEDRLITAVELSDPKRAAEYGYSEAMVEETIHQAAALVDHIHFREVLRWSRLALWGVAAVLLTIGAYGMAWGGSMVFSRAADADRSLVELNDVVSIFFERNVLLDNEPWPAPGPVVVRPVGVDIKETLKGKKAQLKGKSELERRRYVFFWQAPSGDVEVLRETKATVEALSYEYIVYDRDAPNRWRELRVADLHSGHLDAGVDIDPRELPRDWRSMDYGKELGKALRAFNANVDSDEKVKPQLEKFLPRVNELVTELVKKREPGIKKRLGKALGEVNAQLDNLEEQVKERLKEFLREADVRVDHLDKKLQEQPKEVLEEINALIDDLDEKDKARLEKALPKIQEIIKELSRKRELKTRMLEATQEINERASELLPVDPREQLTVEEARFYNGRWKPVGWRQQDLKERIDQALRRIDEMLDDPRMARKLARRKQPSEIHFDTGSRSDRETYEAMKEKEKEDNVYEQKVDVEDTSIPFAITADDDVSPTLRLYVWPKPRMEKVDYQTLVPAYLHHLPEAKGVAERALAASVVGQVGALSGSGSLLAAATLPPERPYDDDQLFLAPRKQRLADLELNVANVGRSEIALPISSDITLIARCNKPLDVFGAARVDRGKLIELPVEAFEGDARRFRVKLTNVVEPAELRFEFSDTDGDSGRQTLFITPTTDETPQIKLFQPDVLRMVEDKYLATPSAVIPFKIVVSDDNGLSSLTYLYTLQEVASQSAESRRAAATAAGIGLVLGGSEAPLTSLIYNYVLPASLQRSEEVVAGTQPVAHFKQQFEALRSGSLQDIEKQLLKPLPRTRQAKGIREYAKKDLGDLDDYLRDNEADVDKSKPFKGFNVGDLQHREGGVMVSLRAPEGQLQKTFLMLITLEVRDTNIYRPGRGNRQSSQQYPFLIVSDTELLFQISLEEQRLFDELQKSFAEMEKARSQLSALRFDIPSMPGARGVDYVGFSVRAEEIDKTVRESLRVTTKVHADYDRILREMRTNRIHEGDKKQIVERVKDNIVGPLGKVKEGDFPYAQEATANLRKILDSGEPDDAKRLASSRAAAEAAEKEMDRVLNSLREVLVHMAGIVEIGKLIAKIRELEQREQNSLNQIKQRKEEIEKSIFDQLDSPKKDEKDKEKKDK
jgi:hypothetical protein